MNEQDGPRGSGWHGPTQEIKTKGFRVVAGIPSTLLIERAKFASRWKCEPLRARNTRSRSYVVWNSLTGDVVWVGDSPVEGEALQQRLAGWQEAETFPPAPRPIVAFSDPAPAIQLTEPDDTPPGPTQDKLLAKRMADRNG